MAGRGLESRLMISSKKLLNESQNIETATEIKEHIDYLVTMGQ